MSSDADAHKVGLIPVTLMVSGNIMGSGVFLLPANLASTGGIAIYPPASSATAWSSWKASPSPATTPSGRPGISVVKKR